MKRGDLVRVALPGDYGKPRPALVVQSDHFDAHPSVTLLPVTSHLREAPLFRVTLAPDDGNGLRTSSQVMVDKAVTVARGRIGEPIGTIGADAMLQVERSLALFLGIAR